MFLKYSRQKNDQNRSHFKFKYICIISFQSAFALISSVKNFNAADYFKTHPSLVNRTYNRPTNEMLKKGFLNDNLDTETLEVSIQCFR